MWVCRTEELFCWINPSSSILCFQQQATRCFWDTDYEVNRKLLFPTSAAIKSYVFHLCLQSKPSQYEQHNNKTAIKTRAEEEQDKKNRFVKTNLKLRVLCLAPVGQWTWWQTSLPRKDISEMSPKKMPSGGSPPTSDADRARAGPLEPYKHLIMAVWKQMMVMGYWTEAILGFQDNNFELSQKRGPAIV